jgi:hypothetical protein
VSEKTITAILAIIFIGVLGLAIALGVSSESFWVGALAFIGVVLSLTNFGTMGNLEEVNQSFYIIHFLSLICIACAAWLANLEPLWMVIILITFGILPSIFASDFSFKQSKAQGYLLIFLNLLSTPLAIALPAIVLNLSGKQSIEPTTWAWSLAVGGVAVLAVGLFRAVALNPGEYFICVALGLTPLVGAAWLVGFQTGWWWVVPLISSALLIGFGGGLLPKWKTKTGTIGIILAIFIGLIGVGLPLMNAGILPNPFLASGKRPVSISAPKETFSAVDYSSTQLAAAEATATQAYLDEQERVAEYQTQTQQSIALYAEQTRTAAATLTLTPTATPAEMPEVFTEAEETDSANKPGPGFFNAIGTFLWQAVKSVWGIVYLLLFIGIGQLWVKRWGGISILILLLLVVGFFGGRQAGTLNQMVDIVSSGPATWWIYTLFASSEWTETFGWGILGSALIVTVLLIPAIKVTNRYSQKVLSAQNLQENMGNTAAQQFLSSNAPGCRESLATWIYLVAASVLPIALWVALQRIATASVSSFPFLFIPNLAVPNWRPVWHYSYFVLGGIFLLGYLLYLRLLSKAQDNNPFAKFGIWGAAPVSIIMSLLVPAGVLLYMTGQLILMSILLPILSPKPEKIPYISPQPAPPPPPKPKDDFEAYLDEIQRLAKETAPEDEPPEEPEIKPTIGYLEGSALHTLSTSLVGGYLKVNNWLCILDERGKLFWLVNGIVRSETTLPMSSPAQLHNANDERLLAVSREGKVIPISATQDFKVEPALDLGTAIRYSATNTYGTLLAYVPQDQPATIHGLFITAKRDQLFLDLGSEAISCLAFSQNARYLAVGTELGKMIVIDIATHQRVLTVPDPYYGPVRLLDATEDEKWITVYGDGWMAIWDMKGVQTGPVELSSGATCLTTDKSRSHILIGDQAGYLWAYPGDLQTLEFSKQVQEGEVTHIFTATDGSIITAGERRVLRKLST